MINLSSYDVVFLNALMEVENGIKKGYRNGLWFPHESVEGGTPTIAYGHKLTVTEYSSGVYDSGIGELAAVQLMIDDCRKAYDQLEWAWTESQKTVFTNIPKKYQYVLLDLVYNTGINKVYRSSSWKWPKLAQAIKDRDDQQVYEQSMRYFTNPQGQKRALTSRTNKICSSLGLRFIPVAS